MTVVKTLMDRVRKEKIKQFVAFTAAESSIALEYLTRHDFNLEIAVDAYFTHPPPPSAAPAVDRGRIEALFGTYAAVAEDDAGADEDDGGGGGGDEMTFAGIERLMADLHCSDPADPGIFLLAFHLHARTIGVFTRTEFVDGLVSLSLDTLDKLRAAMVGWRQEIKQNPAVFKDFYAFLFEYGRGPNEQRRSIDVDTARALWGVSLTRDRFPLLDRWLQFLEDTKVRVVTKDVWLMLLEFAAIKDPAKGYDASSSWPTLLDDFVAYYLVSSSRT